MLEANTEMSFDAAVEHAKRAFALQKYEQAVDYYATALELITKTHGDDAPETADLYLSYGKALLENAITQTSVLGKEQPEDGAAEDEPAQSSSNGPILSFSGDGDEDAVDLFSAAENMAEEAAEQEDDDEGAEDGEPEDDFNAAWEVLDLARAIYTKQTENGQDDDVQLKLADTFIALGDVSLETEKFDAAITDYTAALDLKEKLLPRSSRQVAEAHYKLSMVLDLTSGRLGDAITHAERALESIEARLADLENAAPSASTSTSAASPPVPDPKGKGKGKLVTDEVASSMSKAQIEAEMKELRELREDLAIKVEELKTRPDEPAKKASEMVAQALDAELNVHGSSTNGTQVVNEMVVKKKKKPVPQPEASGSGSSSPMKRKAEDDSEGATEGKKVRLSAEP
ncbi:hypothetical protein FB45DRAFT_979807 [Roridomyces roridus]|uniref:Tetratricopeptide SHNi-TPR domain-containing protein n=1 Tax=Roridomyces roridus TaxID=1738132 RepID=A0AAD7BNH1_9AGAR|nr:hypothetical protein FB45DRAFT_979807 [Roridomyces roridus]